MIPRLLSRIRASRAQRAADQEALDICARAAITERRSLYDLSVFETGILPGPSDLDIDAFLAELDLLALPITLGILHDHREDVTA